jgi:hypothetical protein
MKILSLSFIFLGLFYYYWPTPKSPVSIDAVRVKASAPSRSINSLKTPIKRKAPPVRRKLEKEEVERPQIYEEAAPTISATREPGFEEEIPLHDAEKEWQGQLRETLNIIDPRHGEAMFSAYVAEKSSFQSELDELIRTHQKSYDLEYLIEELEFKHEEKLEQIFGSYYEELKFQEGKYKESLPQMSESSFP